MVINLIGRENNVGLSADIEVLTSILEKEHLVRFRNIDTAPDRDDADIDIFLEIINDNWLFGSGSRKRVLIPNPEWFQYDWRSTIRHFDAIFCKSVYAQNIFKNLNGNALFTSFTSRDKFDPSVERENNKWIHIAGKSSMKGTDAVIEAWERNRDFPDLFLLRNPVAHIRPIWCPNIRNFLTVLPVDLLNRMMNASVFHLCPSTTEGFGHYIWEALSCGAIVLTTDAPPMNEFVPVESGGQLIPYESRRKKMMATEHYVSASDLIPNIRYLLKISDEEILERQTNARTHWKKNDSFFKERLFNELSNLNV